MTLSRLRFPVGVCASIVLGISGCYSPAAEDAGAAEETDVTLGVELTSPTSASAIQPEWCETLPRSIYADLERVVVDSDWFEVYAVGEGVFAIYEPMQWQEVISYLISGEDRALLFDTGMGIAPISDVVAELTDLPVVVLNSHTHMDHIGGNAEFDAIIAMDTDYTRERSAGMLNASVRNEIEGDALCGPLPPGFTSERYETRAFEITEFARDGHAIDLGGRTLRVVHIPGHTPDAVALHDEEEGYLWTGDSFYEGAIWLFAAETDLEAYRASLARLARLVPSLTRVFPAHNTPVVPPARLTALEAALEGALDGTLEGSPDEDGLVRYDAGAFSLLLRR